MVRVWGQVVTDGGEVFGLEESRTDSFTRSTKVDHERQDSVEERTSIKDEHVSSETVEQGSGHSEKHSGAVEVVGDGALVTEVSGGRD